MEIETLNAMNEALLSLMIIKVIALMIFLFTAVGLVIYLAGVAWLCYQETPQSAPHPRKSTMDNGLGDHLSSDVSRREPALPRISVT